MNAIENVALTILCTACGAAMAVFGFEPFIGFHPIPHDQVPVVLGLGAIAGMSACIAAISRGKL